MDAMKMLSFDAKTYQELISGYTSDPYVIQAVNNLNSCLESDDKQGIILFLGRLKTWYAKKLPDIRDNQYVINFESHVLAKQQIDDYYETLLTKDFEGVQESLTKDEEIVEAKKIGYNIFVSHSSKDEEICTAFVHMLERLGVPEENILYSSSERFGIPADMDIFQYLKSSISERFNVYYMLSDNYYESVYCLNEMGAAWINQNESSTFILPDFKRSIDGVIDSNKKAYRLDNVINLNQLREKIENDFNKSISNNKWDEEKERFLKIVKQQ